MQNYRMLFVQIQATPVIRCFRDAEGVTNFFNCFEAVVSQLDRGENFLVRVFSFLSPFLPLALAAANPAKVLSRIICRSKESEAQARRPVVRAEDAKHQLAATRGCVNCFGQADKPNSSDAKIFNQCQQMFEGTSQPVKPPHNQLLFGYYSHPSSAFTIRNILEKFTTALL